jgi:hypothetical protein
LLVPQRVNCQAFVQASLFEEPWVLAKNVAVGVFCVFVLRREAVEQRREFTHLLGKKGRGVQSLDACHIEHRVAPWNKTRLAIRRPADHRPSQENHMSHSHEQVELNKTVVKSFYEGGVAGDISGFGAHLHDDFVCSAPDYLPWGGDTKSASGYLNVVLPQVAKVLDFKRFSYDSITAEGDHVVALINVGVASTASMIKISEHWSLHEGRARSIWVAYFEPAALLELIERNKR